MAKFKANEEVVQIVTPIQGRIKERRVDGDDDLFCVVWEDTEGYHERWFKEDEIQSVGA